MEAGEYVDEDMLLPLNISKMKEIGYVDRLWQRIPGMENCWRILLSGEQSDCRIIKDVVICKQIGEE